MSNFEPTQISVSGQVNWVSDDGRIAIIHGFGYVYADSQNFQFQVGSYVDLDLKLWEKNTENKGKVRRFYVQPKQ